MQQFISFMNESFIFKMFTLDKIRQYHKVLLFGSSTSSGRLTDVLVVIIRGLPAERETCHLNQKTITWNINDWNNKWGSWLTFTCPWRLSLCLQSQPPYLSLWLSDLLLPPKLNTHTHIELLQQPLFVTLLPVVAHPDRSPTHSWCCTSVDTTAYRTVCV